MATDNGGKWQLAFWLMGIICTVWLLGLTNGVIANDNNSRAREDKILDKITIQYAEVIQRLTRIETSIAK